MRIVYGVSGEGSGHSSRARELLTHLEETGHDVRVVSYDRGLRNLAGDFDVTRVEGLGIATREGRVSKVRTFTENLVKVPDGVRSVRALRRDVFDAFQPDVVLTDFEPMTAYLASHLGLPLVSIDNQHRMRYLDSPVPPGRAAEARSTRAIIRMMVPRPDVSLVTTFWPAPARNDHTFAFPPILRRAVIELEVPAVAADAPVLVYLTKSLDGLLDVLGRFPRERFLVYGSDRTEASSNVTYMQPSQAGFLADLARAKAVVSTAGFTLMTEALHLAKPMLALPLVGQYEQELNAFLLEEAGYGHALADSAPEAALAGFLYRLPELAAALEKYPRTDNRLLLARLDQLLADDAREARAFRARRS